MPPLYNKGLTLKLLFNIYLTNYIFNPYTMPPLYSTWFTLELLFYYIFN